MLCRFMIMICLSFSFASFSFDVILLFIDLTAPLMLISSLAETSDFSTSEVGSFDLALPEPPPACFRGVTRGRCLVL